MCSSPLASCGLREIFVISGLVDTSPWSFLPFHLAFFLCVSANKFPLCMRTPVVSNQRLALPQGDLILINYLCNVPLSK